MAGMIRNARMGVKLAGSGGTALLLVGAMAITTYLGIAVIGEKIAIMHRASGVAESAGEAPKVVSQADLHATPAPDLKRLSASLAMYGKEADEAVLTTQHNNELWFGPAPPLRLGLREDLTSAADALAVESVSDAGNQALESLMLIGALILGLVIAVNLILARLAVNSITVLTGVMRDMARGNPNVEIIPASDARNARECFGKH